MWTEPARSELYPHVPGHRTFDNLIEEHESNLFRILRNADYQVAIAGDRGDEFAGLDPSILRNPLILAGAGRPSTATNDQPGANSASPTDPVRLPRRFAGW